MYVHPTTSYIIMQTLLFSKFCVNFFQKLAIHAPSENDNFRGELTKFTIYFLTMYT